MILLAATAAMAGPLSEACYFSMRDIESKAQVAYWTGPDGVGVLGVRVESWTMRLAEPDRYRLAVTGADGATQTMRPDPHLPETMDRPAGVGWTTTFGMRLLDVGAFPLGVVVSYGPLHCEWVVDSTGRATLVAPPDRRSPARPEPRE